MKLIEAIIGIGAGFAAIAGYNKLTTKKDDKSNEVGETVNTTTATVETKAETKTEEIKPEVIVEKTDD